MGSRRNRDASGAAGNGRGSAESGGFGSAAKVRKPLGDVASGDFLRRARASLARGTSLDEAVSVLAPGAIGARDILGAGRRLRHAVGGAGPVLQPLLEDRSVTDILVNGTRGVWVDRGLGLEAIPQARDSLACEDDVRALAVRLAAACGQRLDDSCPIVDGTFGGGLRLHAVLPPLAAEGPLISLRAHRQVSYSLDELQEMGTLAGAVRPIVDAMVESKANVIVSGATGSGKTTLLSAILGEVSASERILVIEESSELRPAHPHVVHLQIRRANVQGKGEGTMSELVRAAMRMRPDRIVLGECRGAEVRDVLSALNTGHEGGWATVHANSAADVPARLVALGALAGMGESVVAAQASSALDAVLHIERSGSRRRLSQIAVLEREAGELHAQVALECARQTAVKGPGWLRLAERIGV